MTNNKINNSQFFRSPNASLDNVSSLSPPQKDIKNTMSIKVVIKETFETFIQRTTLNRSTKKTEIRDINSEELNGQHTCYHIMRRESFTYLEQTNSNKEKYFVIERWIRESIVGLPYNENLKVGDIEYRICYYIISRKPGSERNGKWYFGESCPLIPVNDFERLIKKAKKEKVLLPKPNDKLKFPQ